MKAERLSAIEKAIELFRAGDLVKAEAACRTLLAADPDGPEGLLLLADIEAAQGRTDAAIAGWRRVLTMQPRDAAIHRRLAGALLTMGLPAQALPVLQRALELEPDNVRALNNYGQALMATGDPAAAQAPLARAIALDPGHSMAHYNLGLACQRVGATFEALEHFDQALNMHGDRPLILLAKGRMLVEVCRFEEALASFDAALALSAGLAAARLGRAQALVALGSMDAAVSILDSLLSARDPGSGALDADVLAVRAHALLQVLKLDDADADAALAVKLDPANAAAHVSRGLVQLTRGDAAGALQSFDEAAGLRPALGRAHAGRGHALERLGRVEDALLAHERAAALGWFDARSLLGVGKLMLQLNRFANAHAAFCAAARLRPDDWHAQEGIAMTLVALRRFEEAVPVLQALTRAAPWLKNLAGHLFHARLQCCDWHVYDETASHLAARVRAGEHVDAPWSFLIHNASADDQLICAGTYAADQCAGVQPIRRSARRPGRIRLAYLSADFHGHATSYLAAGLFERHDRTRFETTAISYGPPDAGPMRARLTRAFDRFVDVAAESDEAIAVLLDELGIDIAIDMKGFTTGGRPRVMAHRGAPVQVAFLAFPGTMGSPHVDYIVADRFVIPDSARAYYSERVIRMPGCYQVNDASRAEAPNPGRRGCGLPEAAFVFCGFNANCKISPAVFDGWMRILARAEGAVLWLLEGPAAAMRNLRARAEHRGIDASRLQFAPPVPVEEHWARLQLADVFLDTVPCNAHTTASDALWAGVPLVTLTGATFAGRVATSLLHAVGLPELCVSSMAEYEQLATRLAHAPVELAMLRDRLKHARYSASLFDTAGYCRDLEAAYGEIHARQLRGEPPSFLDVAALSTALL